MPRIARRCRGQPPVGRRAARPAGVEPPARPGARHPGSPLLGPADGTVARAQLAAAGRRGRRRRRGSGDGGRAHRGRRCAHGRLRGGRRGARRGAAPPPRHRRGAASRRWIGSRGGPASPKARRAVEFADPRRDERRGVPQPGRDGPARRAPAGAAVGGGRPGWPRARHGRFRLARARVAGEFDGFVKYGRLLRPGQVPTDVVFAEKRREDAMRTVLRGFVRWVWDEIDAFEDVARPGCPDELRL